MSRLLLAPRLGGLALFRRRHPPRSLPLPLPPSFRVGGGWVPPGVGDATAAAQHTTRTRLHTHVAHANAASGGGGGETAAGARDAGLTAAREAQAARLHRFYTVRRVRGKEELMIEMPPAPKTKKYKKCRPIARHPVESCGKDTTAHSLLSSHRCPHSLTQDEPLPAGGGTVFLARDESRHATRALRLKPGDHLVGAGHFSQGWHFSRYTSLFCSSGENASLYVPPAGLPLSSTPTSSSPGLPRE
jgi:hypothetical protein